MSNNWCLQYLPALFVLPLYQELCESIGMVPDTCGSRRVLELTSHEIRPLIVNKVFTQTALNSDITAFAVYPFHNALRFQVQGTNRPRQELWLKSHPTLV